MTLGHDRPAARTESTAARGACSFESSYFAAFRQIHAFGPRLVGTPAELASAARVRRAARSTRGKVTVLRLLGSEHFLPLNAACVGCA